MSSWIDGKALAAQIHSEVASKVSQLRSRGITPGLAVILVGDNPASQVYVRGKVKTCRELGMNSEKIELDQNATTEAIRESVMRLNERKDVHGILVQVPLPAHVDARRVLEAVSPDKDVDGFHPVNVGRLVAGRPLFVPCTPAGILEIFKRSGIPLRGRRVVVAGRSDIVGKPMALLLLQEDATVTVCHSKTRDLATVCREADILVVAIGRPAMIDDNFVKPEAVVIDVGVNRVDALTRIKEIFGDDPGRMADYSQKGYTLVGDVDAPKVYPVASRLTPVPGGVGPLTIAMLMVNTVRAAAHQTGSHLE